jgi:hypothetical protein
MNAPLGIPGGVILDTSTLARLGDSRTISFLVATAGTGLHRLYASLACVDAADRLRPGIARHTLTGLAGLLDPVELTVSAVLWAREHLPTEPVDIAHTAYLAWPGNDPEWPKGRTVVTTRAEIYQGWGLSVHVISD